MYMTLWVVPPKLRAKIPWLYLCLKFLTKPSASMAMLGRWPRRGIQYGTAGMVWAPSGPAVWELAFRALAKRVNSSMRHSPTKE